MELALFGADFGTPAMKMPICAMASTFLGTIAKSSLPTSLDCVGSSDFIGVAGILNDRACIAAEDRRPFLIRIIFDHARRCVLLHGADEEIGRRPCRRRS